MSSGIKELNNIKMYRNSDILKIIAFIPPCHKHLRLVVVTKDQIIVFHEATVAAIVRAYIDITTHPTRKAVEYAQSKLDKSMRKPGYAEDQLIETNSLGNEIINEWAKVLGFKECNTFNK